MVVNNSLKVTILLLLMAQSALSATIRSLYTPDATIVAPRQLQEAGGPSEQVAIALQNAIQNANSLRKEAGINPLSLDSNLGTVISQWQLLLTNTMSLSSYAQIFGYLNTLTYIFQAIPIEHIQQVILRTVEGWEQEALNSIGFHYTTNHPSKAEVYLMMVGGQDEEEVYVSREEIDRIVEVIKAEGNVLNGVKLQQTHQQIQDQIQSRGVVPILEQIDGEQQPRGQASGTHEAPSQATLDAIQQKYQQQDGNYTTLNNTDGNFTDENNTNSQQGSQQEESELTHQASLQAINNSEQSKNQVLSGWGFDSRFFRGGDISGNVGGASNSGQLTTTTTTVTTRTSRSTDSGTSSSQSSTATTTYSSGGMIPIPIPSSSSSTSQPTRSISTGSLPLIAQTTSTTTKTFNNIVLNHAVPDKFIQGQNFIFKGKITITNLNGIRVNIIFTRVSDQKRFDFYDWVPANTLEFEVQTKVDTTGQFFLSIFPGSRGVTARKTYRIEPPSDPVIISRPPQAPTNLRLGLDANDLVLRWDSPETTKPALAKVQFSQPNGARVEFWLSNYQTLLKVPFGRFAYFRRGNTTVRVSQGYSNAEGWASQTSEFSESTTSNFDAGQHHYDIWKEQAGLRRFGYRKVVGETLTLSGLAGQGVNNEVILVTPDLQILSFYFDSSKKTQSTILKKGERLFLQFTVDQPGQYILEVNDASGEALVNVPLYVGEMYPLLPDFKDLSPTFIDRAALNVPTSLEERCKIVLNLVNRIRAKYRVGPVAQDDKLNSLAQDYSNQMIRENFIGHYDLQGRGPGDRARLRGILQGIGENIAVNSNLTEGQLMLERSPVHLRNMVSNRWIRVGLGIDQSQYGSYYITQHFSSRDLRQYPLTPTQIAAIRQDFLNLILDRYSFIRRQDPNLSSALKDYQSSSPRPNVLTFLRGRGYNSFAVSNVKVSYNSGEYLELLRPTSFDPPSGGSYSEVGITVEFVDGMVQVFAAYK